MFKYILLFGWILNFFGAYSQLKGAVTGITPDGQTKPIMKASVTQVNSQTTVYTHENGHFDCTLIGPFPDTLVIMANGYQTEKVPITEKDRFNGIHIQLYPVGQLDELVVDGTRTNKHIQRLNPLLVEEIGSKELKKAACCNLSESFETSATVDVTITDAVSGSKKIQLLGLDGNYTHFQQENIPILSGLERSQGITTIPGTWISSIQLAKGTGSVTNGYESVSGSVNLSYSQAPEMERFAVNGYLSSFGRSELNLHSGTKVGTRWKQGSFVHVSGSQTELDQNKDGFRDIPLNKTISALHRWHFQGEKMETQIGISGYEDERKGGQLKSFNNRYEGTILNRHLQVFAKTGFLFPKKKYRNLGVVYQASIHEQGGQFGARYFYGQEKRGYVNVLYNDVIGSAENGYTTGVSMSYQDARSRLDTIPLQVASAIPGAFFEYTRFGTRLTAVIGMRADLPSSFTPQFSPRLHLKYILTEQLDLRFTTGRAWRIPNYLADNLGLLATSRTWSLPTKLEIESAWNTGISLAYKGKLNKKPFSWTMDLYHVQFENQLVVDRDASLDTFIFNYQNNTQSTVFQIEGSLLVARGLTIRPAYKWMNVVARYDGKNQQQVMTPKHRWFMNIAYTTRNKRWDFDVTGSLYSKMRLHSSGNHTLMSGLLPTVLSQVTHHFKRMDVYIGGENLANFKQANPIIGVDQPFGPKFDATRVWAPITGTMIYAGFRFNLKNKKDE